MIVEHPKRLVLIGFVLVLLGVILPLLMVIEVIRASFLISFLAYGASVGGLFMGFIGALMLAKVRSHESMREGFPRPVERPSLRHLMRFRRRSRTDDVSQ